jgi:hypothetical protein
MSLSLTRPPHVPPEQWERALRDYATYRRELPRLLQEGHAGQFALIREDQVLSVWDTVGDALQAASERFGLAPVATFKINPLDVERFALLDAQLQAAKEAACPS